MTPTITDNTLHIGTFQHPLPALAQPAHVHIWQVPADYQSSGYFVSVQAAGQVQELPACAAEDANFVATLELAASPAAQFDAARAERAAAVLAETNTALTALSASYPDLEIGSWTQQVKEAEALHADPAANTPLLDALATARGIERTDLAGRVLVKAAAYAEQSGKIIGARQRIEDLLDAVTDQDALATVPTLAELLA